MLQALHTARLGTRAGQVTQSTTVDLRCGQVQTVEVAAVQRSDLMRSAGNRRPSGSHPPACGPIAQRPAGISRPILVPAPRPRHAASRNLPA